MKTPRCTKMNIEWNRFNMFLLNNLFTIGYVLQNLKSTTEKGHECQ